MSAMPGVPAEIAKRSALLISAGVSSSGSAKGSNMGAKVRAGRARRKGAKNALPIAPDSAISRPTLIPDSSAGRAFDC